MLALNGIFILVTKHGLEYPMFYQRLYNLLSADAFQVMYRCSPRSALRTRSGFCGVG